MIHVKPLKEIFNLTLYIHVYFQRKSIGFKWDAKLNDMAVRCLSIGYKFHEWCTYPRIFEISNFKGSNNSLNILIFAHQIKMYICRRYKYKRKYVNKCNCIYLHRIFTPFHI